MQYCTALYLCCKVQVRVPGSQFLYGLASASSHSSRSQTRWSAGVSSLPCADWQRRKRLEKPPTPHRLRMCDSLTALFLLLLAATGIHAQTYPRMEYMQSGMSTPTLVPNNSFVNRGRLGSSTPLTCLTDLASCCANPVQGDWTNPDGSAVYQGESGAGDFYVTRGSGAVHLNRISGGPASDTDGVWRCDIPDASNVSRSFYVYLGDSESGQLTSAAITFTALHTAPNVNPPGFTLTCRSVGGPATLVVWDREGQEVQLNANHVSSQFLVDATANTVYENRLRIQGRENGTYTCIVSSNRDAAFGQTGSTITSGEFAVQAGGSPANLLAVPQEDTNNIRVTWDALGSPVTGYIVYYRPDGGTVSSRIVAGGNSNTVMLVGPSLMSDISIVALTSHLPGPVVGPVRPAALSPPTVEIADPSPVLSGSFFSLTCSITVPSVATGPPTVQWVGPLTSMAGTVSNEGAGRFTSTATIVAQSLGYEGEYTCTARYPVGGQKSPPSSGSVTITINLAAPVVDITVSGSTYLSNSVSMSCTITLVGVTVGDVDANLSWMKDDSNFTGATGVTITRTVLVGVIVQSTIVFHSLQPANGGKYKCSTTINRKGHPDTGISASGTENLVVVVPTIAVTVLPTALRILDIMPYNDCELNCTAQAIVEGQSVPLSIAVIWTRQQNGSAEENVPSSDFTTSGSPGTGYRSTLSRREGAMASIFYYCTASLVISNSIQGSSQAVVTVVGPTAPVVSHPFNAIDIFGIQVTIQWTVPSIAYIPETYMVQYGQFDHTLSSNSSVVASGADISITDKTYHVVLMGLEPVTEYFYRVVSTNTVGQSTTAVDRFNTTNRRTSPPRNFRYAPVGVGYNFLWDPPAELFHSTVIDYTVTCDPSLDGVEDRQATATATSVGLELGPGLSYSCRVSARNSVGPSDPASLPGLITTAENAPSGPPTSLLAETGARNLTLSWSPPSPPDRNGAITSYKVDCTSSGVPSSSGETAELSLVVSSLVPFTVYNCCVLASTAVGTGPSSCQLFRTKEAAPDGAPTGFTHSVVNGMANVSFNWSPPPDGTANGDITLYTVSCSSSSSQPMVWMTKELRLMVDSLSPGTLFQCTVSASTAVGESPASQPPLGVLTVPGAPGNLTLTPVTSDPMGLLAVWSGVGGVVSGYTVRVTPVEGIGGTSDFSSKATSFTVESAAVGGYRRVSIRVVAINDAGYGPESEAVEEQTPPIAPGPVGAPSFTGTGDDSVNVSWTQPAFPNGIIRSYIISVDYYDGRGQITSKDVDGNETFSVTITSNQLVPGTPYNGTVVAANHVGRGQGSPQLFFTQELTPLADGLSVAVERSSTVIVVSWKLPSPVASRGIIVQFIIYISVGTVEASSSSQKREVQQTCQEGGCAFAGGESSICCRVLANQTLLEVTGLDPKTEYSVTVSAGNSAGKGQESAPVIASPDDSGDDETFPIFAVVGAVVGVVLVLIVIAIIIVLVLIVVQRRGRKLHSKLENTSQSNPRYSKQLGVQLESVRNFPTDETALNIIPSAEESERMRPIPVDHFSEHVRLMHQDRDKGFEVEYQSVSDGALASHDVAQTNKPKNRFANIYPYDHSRVALSMLDQAEDSTYINASFVDGYSHKNAYIAAQGPMPNTITDFWRMIWEHKLNTIIMLTKPVEKSKRKCEVYWADTVGEVFNAGTGISVHYKQLLQFADYELRVFHVTHRMHPNIPPLEITHFQFLSWPDHGVPQFATALIAFIRRVRHNHTPNSPPLLVHCSAGVGRTGTYILLDAMLERIASESSVNVYEFLWLMRTKRAQMVQTLAQYVFIHDALEELITCGDMGISSANLRGKMNKMHKIIPEKAVSGFSDQFKLLNEVSRQPNENDCSDALQPHNQEKNRYLDRVPYNMGRVRLRPTGVSGADYINASFTDGYKRRNAYLATQAPLKNTQCDFWRMVWEWKSRAIVMLCGMEENGEVVVYPYWPEQVGLRVLYGKCAVTLTAEESLPETPEVIVRKLEITDAKNTSSHTITLYHVTEWPEKGRVNPSILLHVMDHLTRTQQNTGNQAITVMCNDGMGRTGTFICIHAMLERVKTEGVVDFFQFIKSSRINRPGMVSAQEHYILCHDTVADYIDSFDTYANFKAKS